jgi:DNA-binding Lrp family transcriptional regulator
VKNIDLKLIHELMQNSRRSDRQLAKKLGVSQPTVTRTRQDLEREGLIREYTIIPNLHKLGYQIAAATFVRFKKDIDTKEAEKLRKIAEQRFSEKSYAANVVFFERGEGFGYTGMIISFHKNYPSFMEYLRMIRQYPVLEPDIKNFLIDLNDRVHYRPLTMATLAEHLLKAQE